MCSATNSADTVIATAAVAACAPVEMMMGSVE